MTPQEGCRAAVKKFAAVWTLPSWPSWRTVVNPGRGFQIEGVFAPCFP